MSVTVKPGTTEVWLTQGDDFDPIVEKAQAVEKAATNAAPRRLGDGPLEDSKAPVAKATASLNGFMEDANARAVKVTLTALPRKEFRRLLNEHPPRTIQGAERPETHPDDSQAGFNAETFGDALVPACMSEDEFGPLEERVAFLDSLSDGYFQKLYAEAVRVNRTGGPDPKARLLSATAQTSDEISSSPERLA